MKDNISDRVDVDGQAIPIHGVCPPAFTPVLDAFAANFATMGEVGARVTVLRDGETVVDLCGGHTTAARERAWDKRTLVCCMSVSKGVTALAAHLLADRGRLDYEAPVARYWPEFAQNGKQSITVRQALGHQASLGIIESAEPGDVLDWNRYVSKIAAQAPNWPPGTNECYHSLTYGFIIGEIVRRIDGRSIDGFIAAEIAAPLDADFILGCSDADLERVVAQIPNPDNELVSGGGLFNANTMRLFNGLPADPEFRNSPAWVKTVMPSGGGVSNALGLARIFAPLASGGRVKGKPFLSSTTIEKASARAWHHNDSVFGNEFRVALGLLLHCEFSNFGRDGNVGSAGAGGYTVFADPEHRITFAYTPNRFTTGHGLGEQPARLIDATYRCLL